MSEEAEAQAQEPGAGPNVNFSSSSTTHFLGNSAQVAHPSIVSFLLLEIGVMVPICQCCVTVR